MLDKSKDYFVNITVLFSDVKNSLTYYSVSPAICRVMDVCDVVSYARQFDH